MLWTKFFPETPGPVFSGFLHFHVLFTVAVTKKQLGTKKRSNYNSLLFKHAALEVVGSSVKEAKVVVAVASIAGDADISLDYVQDDILRVYEFAVTLRDQLDRGTVSPRLAEEMKATWHDVKVCRLNKMHGEMGRRE
ncbi:hypothetical protein MCOR25_009269 [Pyricularia grisea]|nr:hypothetical protein MCOR25_009269 [Pyricularia grisea]